MFWAGSPEACCHQWDPSPHRALSVPDIAPCAYHEGHEPWRRWHWWQSPSYYPAHSSLADFHFLLEMKEEVVKQSKEFQTASVENLLQGRKRDREINCTTQITVLTSIHFVLVLSISSPLLNLDHKGQKIKKTFIRKSFKCNYSLNYFFVLLY